MKARFENAAIFACLILSLSLVPPATAAPAFTNLATLNYPTGSNLRRLIQANDGNFYGVTKTGGTLSYGTLFQMTPAGSISNLCNFGDAGGSQPNSLIQGTDGNLYGTTDFGGTNNGYGTVFQFTPAGTRNVLFTFQGTNGSVPVGLTRGPDGSLYGVTLYGGSSFNPGNPASGYGTIFKLSTNGSFTSLFSFNGANGSYPEAPLVLARDGNFYGTTDAGGADTNLNNTLGYSYVGQGTIYQLTPDGSFSSLASFNTTNGGGGISALIPQPDGSFYGSTFHGGASGVGTAFKFTGGSNITTVGSFAPAFGGNPISFVQATDGNFYGLYRNSGSSSNTPYGAIFQFTASGNISLAYSFAAEFTAFGETLMQAADGNFYGSTSQSSPGGGENVFKLGLPLAPVAQSAGLSGGQFTSSWSAVAGQSYQLQYRTDLTLSNWNNLGNTFTATNGSISFTDNIGPDPQRFYRVFVLP